MLQNDIEAINANKFGGSVLESSALPSLSSFSPWDALILYIVIYCWKILVSKMRPMLQKCDMYKLRPILGLYMGLS